mmetsp:Transcript_2595/g.6510  ORF Transcript_2595/g.6510 Transcript_2595/m.6510 type:complete len:203 (-) Transcript_2595:231-839(-)
MASGAGPPSPRISARSSTAPSVSPALAQKWSSALKAGSSARLSPCSGRAAMLPAGPGVSGGPTSSSSSGAPSSAEVGQPGILSTRSYSHQATLCTDSTASADCARPCFTAAAAAESSAQHTKGLRARMRPARPPSSFTISHTSSMRKGCSALTHSDSRAVYASALGVRPLCRKAVMMSSAASISPISRYAQPPSALKRLQSV